MKKILIAILVLVPHSGWCQLYNNPFFDIPVDAYHSPSSYLFLGTTTNLASNSLTNRLLTAFNSGGFINDETKKSSLPYLQDVNQYGGQQNFSVFYAWKTKKNDTRLYLNLGSKSLVNGKFSSGMYKLALFGNKDLAGQTVNFDGFKESPQSFQSLEFGFYNFIEGKKNFRMVWGAGLSLLIGQLYTGLTIPRGSLYTSPDGDTIVLDAKINLNLINRNPYLGLSGLGAALNGFMICHFRNDNEFKFQLSDLGFISSFDHTSLSLDQKFVYTGENINTINGQFTVSDYHLFFDSLASLYGVNHKGPFTNFIAFQARALYSEKLSKTFDLSEGVEYIADGIQKPEISISAMNQFSRSFSGRLGLSLLGYGNYGITAGVGINFGKNICLIAGTQHFEGLVLKDARGQGYYFSIKWTQ